MRDNNNNRDRDGD